MSSKGLIFSRTRLCVRPIFVGKKHLFMKLERVFDFPGSFVIRGEFWSQWRFLFFSPKILRESLGTYMCSNLLTLKMLSTNSFTLTFMVLVVDWLVGLLVGCGRGRNCGCLRLLSRSLSFVCLFFLFCMFLFCFVWLFACLLGFLCWLVVVVIF